MELHTTTRPRHGIAYAVAPLHVCSHCARDRRFLEVGRGAASLAMAARGMLVRAETMHTEALEELQCMNGRRLCLARSNKGREKEGKTPRQAGAEANTSMPASKKRGNDLAARCCTQLTCARTSAPKNLISLLASLLLLPPTILHLKILLLHWYMCEPL